MTVSEQQERPNKCLSLRCAAIALNMKPTTTTIAPQTKQETSRAQSESESLFTFSTGCLAVQPVPRMPPIDWPSHQNRILRVARNFAVRRSPIASAPSASLTTMHSSRPSLFPLHTLHNLISHKCDCQPLISREDSSVLERNSLLFFTAIKLQKLAKPSQCWYPWLKSRNSAFLPTHQACKLKKQFAIN